MKSTVLFSAALVAFVIQSFAHQASATVPFTENFTSSVSNWADNSGLNLATFVPSGGPDGSSYASVTASPANVAANAGFTLFRGQDEFNSSGHAFEGNWTSSGINHFSAYVWHNAPVALPFFARFSTASNFPGVAADNGTIVQPNTWTQLNFAIDPSQINLTLFPEGPSSFYNSVFSALGHVQIGYSAPTGFAGTLGTYTFGLDQVSIATPEPASCLLALGFASIGFVRRRSRV